MKTLIVHYLPTGPESHTLQLLRLFEEVAPKEGREEIDLLATPAPTFTRASMAAYLKRNYRQESLTEAESALLAPHDSLIAQLKSADVLVMAYPMHNFSMPAPVKAYFDAIMFIGETFDRHWTPDAAIPMLPHLKALTLYTSGLDLRPGLRSDFPYWDGIETLAEIEFAFMGFAEWASIGLSLRDPLERPSRLSTARERLEDLLQRWYPASPARGA